MHHLDGMAKTIPRWLILEMVFAEFRAKISQMLNLADLNIPLTRSETT